MILDLNESDDANDDNTASSPAGSSEKIRNRILSIGLAIVGVIAVAGVYLISSRRVDTSSQSEEIVSASRARMDNGNARANADIANEYQIKHRTNGKQSYILHYSFAVKGHTYDGTCDVAHLPRSQTSIVKYDPQNPSMNCLEDEAVADSGPSTGTGGGANGAPLKATMTAVAFYLLQMFIRKFVGKNR